MPRVFVFFLVLFTSVSTWAIEVVFINPGRSDEAFWSSASLAMQAAAQDLALNLQIQYADFNPAQELQIARELVARPAKQQPDYVVFSNDFGMAPDLLNVFANSKIKCFIAFSGIEREADRQLAGLPRGHFPNWIGALVPNAEEAGYLTAQALIAQGRRVGAKARDGRLHVLAIAGDQATSSSFLRNQGMKRAIQASPDVVLDQMVYAMWRKDKAAEQSEWLYERYPETRLIWVGNDQMAWGAMQAAEVRHLTPGKDIWFSAMNATNESMEAVQSGRLSALAAGHFMNGAWALVMINDYARGLDFTAEGLEQRSSMMMLFDAENAQKYLHRFAKRDFNQIDFRRFAKAYNSRLKRYFFSFKLLLDQ